MAEPTKKERGATIALLIASAVALALPLTQESEGFRSKAYYDPAHIATYCYGETKPPILWEKIYSKTDCAEKLRDRMGRDYAPLIADCLPEVVTQRRVKVFAALIDASYNAGPKAVCNSRMARSIRAGQWKAACNGFHGWFTTARDRRTGKRIALRGLVIRRQKEAALCFRGLADA